MPTLHVWVFDMVDSASSAANVLRRQGLLPRTDTAVLLTWPVDHSVPEVFDTPRVPKLEGRQAVALWGELLVEGVFLEPLRRAALGDVDWKDDRPAPYGLTVRTVNFLRDEVIPSRSALLVADCESVDDVDDSLAVRRPVARWAVAADLPTWASVADFEPAAQGL